MSKKARIAKKIRRRGLAKLRKYYIPSELEKDFSDFLCYGMIIRRINPDGTEERLIPIEENYVRKKK